MRVRSAKSLMSASLLIGIIVLSGTLGPAIAGNGWNPPTQPDDKRVGAAFFTMQGQFYTLLGLLDANKLKEAKEFLPRLTSQIEVSKTQCRQLEGKIKNNSAVQDRYDSNLKRFPDMTSKYVNQGAIPANDSVWETVAKAGYQRLSALCGETVNAEATALQPVATSVQNGTAPSSQDVWKLMATLETGSKRSRYFTIILQP